MLKDIFVLKSALTIADFKRLAVFIALMAVAGFVEMATMAASIPFLSSLTGSSAPESFFTNYGLAYLLNGNAKLSHLQVAAVQFCALYAIASLLRIYLIQSTAYLSFRIGNAVGELAFRTALARTYQESKLMHSSLDVVAITNYVNTAIFSVLFPLITIISSAFLLLVLLISLSLIFGVWILYGLALIMLIYALIVLGMRKILSNKGRIIATESASTLRVLQEALASFREIKLGRLEKVFLEEFSRYDRSLRQAQGVALMVQMSPRYIVEAFAVFLIVAAALILDAGSGGKSESLVIIGSLLIGLQRMLPNAQQVFQSWASLRTGEQALGYLANVIKSKKLPLCESNNVAMIGSTEFKSIIFNNVSFKYSEFGEEIFNNLNLNIIAGTRVGIIGPSGSGKSTLVDLLAGLLKPMAGSIVVDGINIWNDIDRWYETIAYVPQSVHLADTTIRQNIAFGCNSENIDEGRVIRAANQAGLASTITRLPKGLDTRVGEKGGLLSGGERQRVAIARAAYKGSKLIIFDEATSALDIETEELVNDYIRGLDKSVTVVVIAHKPSALAICDVVFDLSKEQFSELV